MDISEVYKLLNRLGVTANYTGFFHAAYAVYLASEHPERLLRVTKRLYPDVAKYYKTTWNCVERNIRTIISVAWTANRPLLEVLAQHPLSCKPKAAQFLALLTTYLSTE